MMGGMQVKGLLNMLSDLVMDFEDGCTHIMCVDRMRCVQAATGIQKHHQPRQVEFQACKPTRESWIPLDIPPNHARCSPR
jgi:hypothetical protein